MKNIIRNQKNIDNFDDTLTKNIIELNTKFHDLILDFSQNNHLKKLSKDLSSLTYFIDLSMFMNLSVILIFSIIILKYLIILNREMKKKRIKLCTTI